MKKNKLLIAVFMVVTLLSSLQGYAQSAYQDKHDENRSVDHIMIYFPVGKSTVLNRFYTNAYSLGRITTILSDPRVNNQLDSIVIQGSASLEGGTELNLKLATDRAQSIKARIQAENQIDQEKIKLYPGINWRELEAVSLEDGGLPNVSDVMQIISLPIDDQSKITQIASLGSGESMKYIKKHYAAQMRSAVVLLYANGNNVPINQLTQISGAGSDIAVEKPQSAVAQDNNLVDSTGNTEVKIKTKSEKPLFALKTNLLYDAASIINLEVEMPIGKKWSVLAEVIFPWWLWSDDQVCAQLFSTHLEGRYWFGNRDVRPLMTGWFAGVYAGGGYYDIETRTKGYQGESFVSMGFTGGFTHTINRKKNLRMEYSLGLGYMYTKYNQYTPILRDDEWLLKFEKTGHKSWGGPTKAKISLVWMINGKNK